MSGAQIAARVSGAAAAPPAPERRTVLTAWSGIVAGVLAAVLVVTAPGHAPALAGALLLACVPAGAAVMCWVDTGLAVVQASLTLVLSLAVTAIVSSVMIWLRAWHPDALIAVAAVSVACCGVRLWRADQAAPWAVMRDRAGERARPSAKRGLTGWLVLVLLPGGLGAWAYGVSQLRREAIGPFGLLVSANAWFFLGLAALFAGFLLELSRPGPRTWLLGTYLAGLIVAIQATVPILYGTPEYPWVYKHIGIAQALGRYGRVTDSSNIYQQWPALFATVASVSGLGRVGPLSFAAWAPLAFELADALVLLGVFRMLAGERRIAYLAVLLYEGLIAWFGQGYLSPQAFGYLLWLGIVTIVVRWLLVPPPASAATGRDRAGARALPRQAAGTAGVDASAASHRGDARRRDLLRDRRRAPAHPVPGARGARGAGAARATVAGLAASTGTGGDRGRVPGIPLQPDCPAVRRAYRRQPAREQAGCRGAISLSR